jgi:4-hydroxy-3-methylbut-2-enyl diphosphate reductase
MKLLVAAPRGFCAGVDRAIEIVEKCLQKYGKPVYVRHEIVHNKYVVEDLEKKGAIFVNELFECPKDRPVVFSAHGVAKSVFSEAEERNLQYIDATCPLVTKVHIEAKRYHKLGYQIIMIGHKNHPETIGTMGQLPNGEVLLVENCKDVDVINPRDENKLAYVTQTTLSIDDTLEIGKALKNRFPGILAPHKEDICYATTNRQNAVKKISPLIDGLLVVGSINSSNSKRLVEVGKNAGCRYSQLIDNVNDIDWRSISGSESIGLTAGASAPEILINQVIEEFKKRFKATIEFIEITKEDIQFKIPNSIRN